jgi:hypothetical protein
MNGGQAILTNKLSSQVDHFVFSARKVCYEMVRKIPKIPCLNLTSSLNSNCSYFKRNKIKSQFYNVEIFTTIRKRDVKF